MDVLERRFKVRPKADLLEAGSEHEYVYVSESLGAARNAMAIEKQKTGASVRALAPQTPPRPHV